jgi:hypothetical protein
MKALHAAAVCFAFALFAGPASAQAIDSTRYAAVAYSQKTGNYGYGYDQPSRAAAERRALAECKGDDAEIVTWTQFGYIVLLIAEDNAYGVGEVHGAGVSSADAYRRALAQLRKHTAKKISTVVIVCSGDVAPRVIRD